MLKRIPYDACAKKKIQMLKKWPNKNNMQSKQRKEYQKNNPVSASAAHHYYTVPTGLQQMDAELDTQLQVLLSPL